MRLLFAAVVALVACEVPEAKSPEPQPSEQEPPEPDPDLQAAMARSQLAAAETEREIRIRTSQREKCAEYERRLAEYERARAEREVVLEEEEPGPDPVAWAEENCTLVRLPAYDVMRCTPICFTERLVPCPEYRECRSKPPDGLLVKANTRTCAKERHAPTARLVSDAPMPLAPEKPGFCGSGGARITGDQ